MLNRLLVGSVCDACVEDVYVIYVCGVSVCVWGVHLCVCVFVVCAFVCVCVVGVFQPSSLY